MKLIYKKMFTTLVLLSCVLFANAFSYDFIIDEIGYTITSDSTCEVSGHSDRSLYNSFDSKTSRTVDLTIPSIVSFNNKEYKVTNIGDYAFGMCFGLTSVKFPNSLKSIGSGAFLGCYITSFSIPEGVNSIADFTFCSCFNLASVDIPSSVTSIGNCAFDACFNLSQITIPNKVTNIGEDAFSGCLTLKSITIPSSVVSIGDAAFYGCPKLSSIKVDAANKVYDSRENCNAIIETNSNTIIAGNEYTIFPSSVTGIGNYAFSVCGIKSVNVPNYITSIGDYAFYGCEDLSSVSIHKDIESIGVAAFANCPKISSMEVDEANKVYDSRSNCNAVIETTTNTLISGCKNTTITNVNRIGKEAFRECTGLTSISIPGSVTSIEPGAFESCTGITSISIPSSVTSIHEEAFEGCI